MAELTTFKAAVMLLLHQKPLIFPVKVRRVSLDKDLYGDCTLCTSSEETSIKIRIDKDAPEITQLDSLVHEWAHARLASMPEIFEEHGPMWGVQYAECYSAVF